MKKIIITVFLWELVIGWMSVIFYMSHQSESASGEMSKDIAEKVYENIDLTPERFENKSDEWLIAHYHIFVRKAAHIFQYFILGVLLFLSVGRHIAKGYFVFLLSFGIGALYSVSDELHQCFVPGRSGRATDVLLDSIGILIGCVAVLLTVFIIKKIKMRKGI